MKWHRGSRHGAFTEVLLEKLGQPGLDVVTMAGEVVAEVKARTNG